MKLKRFFMILLILRTAVSIPGNYIKSESIYSEEKIDNNSNLMQVMQDEVSEEIEDNGDNYKRVIQQSERSAKDLDCSSMSEDIVDEIKGYQSTVDTIIDFVTKGKHKGVTYNAMKNFVDTFGPRISGSSVLESSIDSIVSMAGDDGFDDVRTEDVKVPFWVRNSESGTMVLPRVQELAMLGLGGSVGTPDEGISAEVVVVQSFDELTALCGETVAGKIVVYNQEYTSYGVSVIYRKRGAVEAAKLGAVASLIRSITDFSIYSPHTGAMDYDDGVVKIPSASITVEDATLLHRLYTRGETIRINLTMGAVNYPDATSRNTIIDHFGSEMPDDFVIVSGHIDSWDVGAGAMDDAAGSFVGYNANLVLKKLGLRARRTVRTIFFTGEEQGVYGGQDFFERHKNDSSHYQFIMESDMGTFSPRGIGFGGSNDAACVMEEVLKLTASINTTELIISSDGPDISMWMSVGVPIGSLNQERNNYFWYHHSAGDRLEIEDPDTLDRITALWATVAYIAADMSANLQQV